MKKLFFSILVMMTVCATLSARVVSFGVTGGMNINQTEGDDNSPQYKGWSLDSKNGWYAGLQLKFTFPVVGLGLDVAATYSQNEATLQMAQQQGMEGVGTGNLEKSSKTGFITVPLHLRWDINIPAIDYAVAPFVFTGPQASYAVKKLEDDIDTKFNDMEFKSESLLWKWDLGAGVILLKHLQVSYAYEFPLSDGSSFKAATKDIDVNYKDGTHRIGLTYFF